METHNGFIKFILHQRMLIIFATIALLIAGAIAWRTLPIDAFPDVTNVQVMILTDAPGMTPVDVERQVSTPIELAMQGLPDVKQVRSMSKAAFSQVIVVFDDKTDLYFARQLVFERLSAARSALPSWAEPEMGPVSTGLGEIFQYTLESDGGQHTPIELRSMQDWIVAPLLRTIPGVTEVNSFGGFVKQYQVTVDPVKLKSFGVTLDEVTCALDENNANEGGNFVTNGWEQSYVRSVGAITGISDIESIVIKSVAGTPVRIGDLATVAIGGQTRQGAVTRDGKGEAVAGMVIMLRDANSKVVVDRVKKTIPTVQASLPDGVRINPFYDRTSLIEACIETIGSALWQGGLFVILILFLLLGNVRASLIVAFSIPLTACFAFVLMGIQGVSANLMSLGGLAIALGMIVDGSIVITENVARHLHNAHGSGKPTRQVIIGAVSEVARPVLFAILIIIMVFVPLFTLEGHEGKMFKPLALTMVFAMIGSLIVAFTIVPVLASFFLHGEAEKDIRFVKMLRAGYAALLDRVLKKRKTAIAIAVGFFVISLSAVPFMGSEFLPQLDEGSIAINVVRLPSASLEGSKAVGTEIERRIRAGFPEVTAVITKTGRAEISEDPMGPEQNDVIVMLKPRKEWKTGRDKQEIVAAMSKSIAEIPGIRASFTQPIALRVNELISGVKGDLAVKIFGDDLDVLKTHADQAAAKIGSIRGASDVKVELVAGFSQIEIVADRSALARFGLSVAAVNELVKTAVGGSVATTVVEGSARVAVTVRYPEAERNSIAALQNLTLKTDKGASVPLGQVAIIREIEAPAQISRENGMRRIVVECNIRDRDMGGFVAEVQKELSSITQELPPGYHIEYGGQFENQRRAMGRLGVVVPVTILVIFILLFTALKSLKSSLLVLANLPFALVGGILAMVLLGIPLSVSSAIGFIALFGTAVANGTVLVSFYDELERRGMSVIDAVREGSALRFRPLLMTALSAFMGVFPLLFAQGSGSEIQRPLAAVVLGGLISSTILTLVILPAMYVQFNGGREVDDDAVDVKL